MISSISKKGLALMLIIFALFAMTITANAAEVEENTPDPQITSTVVEKPATDVRITIINGIELEPQAPQSDELDAYLTEIMAELLTEDMSTFKKVVTCYDYIIKNTTYGSHVAQLSTPIGDVTCGEITRQYGAVEGYGAVALAANTGMCNAYASAFILMANKIGLDAKLVKGYTKSAYGGYAYHEWAEVNIDGVAYTFDPQLEQSLTRAGLGEYNIFCKTYDQIPGRYSKL